MIGFYNEMTSVYSAVRTGSLNGYTVTSLNKGVLTLRWILRNSPSLNTFLWT